MHHHQGTGRRAATVVIAAVLALSLVATSCGGKKANDSTKERNLEDDCLTYECGESGLADAGKPVRGGTIVYGLEAETSDGWCLPESQLAVPGEMVVRALYDTLTVPNAAGDYVPYLAKSVTPSEDYKTWTIEVRDGITFHDGSALTGEVVKNNLDAYRGAYPGRSPLLLAFVFSNIDKVSAEGQTVTVTTKVPWVAFPAFLFYGNRIGIMGQAQLDDAEDCDTKPIGTGPFEFESWTQNDKLVAKRNDHYWQTAPDGEPYPYADGIEFRVLDNVQVRINSLESNDGVNLMHTANAKRIGGALLDLRDDGKVNLYASAFWAELAFMQLNTTQAPFDDLRIRKAVAMAIDREELDQAQNGGLNTTAAGPFAPGTVAYVEDSGYPDYDPEGAKDLVTEYEADGGEAKFNLTSTTDPDTVAFAERIQTRLEKVGFEVKIIKRKQAELIDDAVGKKYQGMLFRNYPGGDPDLNYVWWYGTDNPVNFAGFDDPDINRILEEGRSEPDQDKRTDLYKELNGVFGEQVYSMWAWYVTWAIAGKANVHNYLGPPLPGEDPSEPGELSTEDPAFQPNPGLANGHSLIGVWIDQ